MTRTPAPKVLMVGPDRSLRGGIASVINGYFNANIQKQIPIHFLGTGVGRNQIQKCVSFAAALAKYDRMLNDFDIVHLHVSARGSFRRKSLMATIAHAKGKKVILHEHSGEFARDFATKGETFRRDVRKAFCIADRVVVLSEEWRDYFAENVCDPAKLIVIHNAVPIPKYSCTPELKSDVLFLGRLDANKSPDVLLRASKQVVELFPSSKFYYAGDGDIKSYERIAADLGVMKNCVFCGWVSEDERECLFSNAGILCLPSKHEAMPMCVLEAMAHGIPVITTPVGGIPQLIKDGVEGRIMPVDDETRLSELLIELLSSPEERGSLGRAAREKVRNEFSIEASIEKIINLYYNLFDSRNL